MDKNALRSLSYGLYIVSSVKDGRFNGQIANTVFQITSEPVTVAISIHNDNLTNEYIRKSGCFSVSILSIEADFKFIGTFGFKSGRNIDKLTGIRFLQRSTGAPVILDNTVAWLELEVIDTKDIGTHTLFIGQLVDAEIINEAIQPMTYDYYHKVIKGKSPKKAPTYIPQS